MLKHTQNHKQFWKIYQQYTLILNKTTTPNYVYFHNFIKLNSMFAQYHKYVYVTNIKTLNMV